MGSWYDYLKGMKKPEHITIEPEITKTKKGHMQVKLRITLQYSKPHIYTKILMVDEVGIDLKRLDIKVEKGEKWGDWGGPIKVGDILYIHKKEKIDPKILPSERVDFT